MQRRLAVYHSPKLTQCIVEFATINMARTILIKVAEYVLPVLSKC